MYKKDERIFHFIRAKAGRYGQNVEQFVEAVNQFAERNSYSVESH